MNDTKQPSLLLHWVAPRTQLRGLIRNNPWLPGACARAVGLYADTALHVPATVLAAVHEAAIDYLTQAPILVLAAAGKSDLAPQEDRQRVAARFKVVCNARPRLKDLMRFYGVAPQLRALSGDVLRPAHHRLLKPLSQIPPSRLAQSIPAAPAEQTAWLAAAERWRALAQRVVRDPDWIVAWAAGNACHRHTDAEPTELIDFASRARAEFDERWNIAEAAAACERWHQAVPRYAFEQLYSPEQLAALADYGPLPIETAIDEHDFTALRSRAQIFAEGRAMHHCVATYAEHVLAGRCWLYSITRNGNRVATMELRRAARTFVVIQVKAHSNARPPAEAMNAAHRFVSRINAAGANARAPAPLSALAAASTLVQPEASSDGICHGLSTELASDKLY